MRAYRGAEDGAIAAIYHAKKKLSLSDRIELSTSRLTVGRSTNEIESETGSQCQNCSLMRIFPTREETYTKLSYERFLL